jgi:ATP-dependent Clp protease ATP-binding subunit ClpC
VGDASAATEPVEPSTRMRILIDTAAHEARGMGHGYVGTEHVLLACHADADWSAAQLLTRLGATEERLRAEILRVLKQG